MSSAYEEHSTSPDPPHVKRVCLSCNCTRRNQATHCRECGAELRYQCSSSGKSGLIRNLNRHLRGCDHCSPQSILLKEQNRKQRIEEVMLRDQQLDIGQSQPILQ